MEEMTTKEKQMNEEILLLRNEFAESWWSHNGWKFKDKDKYESFRFAKQAFLNMPLSSRKGAPSSEVLTDYYVGYRDSRNEPPTHS